MRRSIDVKKHRGRPVRLLMDFLKLWNSPPEPMKLVLPTGSVLEREYGLPAMQTAEKVSEDPRVGENCANYNDAVEKNDFARALQAAEELVIVRGKPEDLAAQASCLIRLGRYDEALAMADRVLSQAPDQAEAWRIRGSALLRLGRLEDAEIACDRSIELDGGADRVWSDRASILLSLGQPEEAIESCEKAIQLNRGDTLAWATRGKALADLGRYEGAAAACEVVVRLEPQNAQACLYLCGAQVELKKYQEALFSAGRAIDLGCKNGVVWTLQGSALAGLKRNAEALRCLDKAVMSGEESSFVQFKRAELLLSLDHWRAGVESLDKALGRFANARNRDAGDTTALIRNLIPKVDNPKGLHLCIRLLALIYGKHKALSPLGQGLIECIPDLVSLEPFHDSAARLWRDSWKAVTGGFPEFRLPLRFLDFAIRYRESGDPRVLVELTQEERAILGPMIGVRVQETA